MDEIKPAARIRRETHTRRSGDLLKQAARQRGIDGRRLRSEGEPAKRAAKRLKLELLRRQQNLETIIQRAYELCQEEVGQELDCDWLTHLSKTGGGDWLATDAAAVGAHSRAGTGPGR